MGVCCTTHKTEKEEKFFQNKIKKSLTISQSKTGFNTNNEIQQYVIDNNLGNLCEQDSNMNPFIHFLSKFYSINQEVKEQLNNYNINWFTIEDLWNNQKFYSFDIYDTSNLIILDLSLCLDDDIHNRKSYVKLMENQNNQEEETVLNLTFNNKIQLYLSSYFNSFNKHKRLSISLNMTVSNNNKLARLHNFLQNKTILIHLTILDNNSIRKAIKLFNHFLKNNNIDRDLLNIQVKLAAFDYSSSLNNIIDESEVNQNINSSIFCNKITSNAKKSRSKIQKNNSNISLSSLLNNSNYPSMYNILSLLDLSANKGYFPYILLNFEMFPWIKSDKIIFFDILPENEINKLTCFTSSFDNGMINLVKINNDNINQLDLISKVIDFILKDRTNVFIVLLTDKEELEINAKLIVQMLIKLITQITKVKYDHFYNTITNGQNKLFDNIFQILNCKEKLSKEDYTLLFK